MARFPFRSKRISALQSKIDELEQRASNWDLKGETLLDLIKESGSTVITPEEAIKVPAVLAATSLRSGLFASFPKVIFRKTKDGREEIPNDPLYKVLAYQPNPHMNAFTFWELLSNHLDLYGNAYAYISRYKGQIRALTPIHPNNVVIDTESGEVMYKVTSEDKVLNGTHSSKKLLHFKDFSLDGLKGKSRVELCSTAIDITRSASNFSKEFFDKGGNAKGVIETEQQLSPEAMKNFSKHWNDSGNHGTPVLDMGKKYKQLSIPMGDAQYKDVQEFQIQEIARIFNVPCSLINENSRSTFSNITQLNLSFVAYGLRPMVKRYEHELESKLLGDDLGKKMIRFDMDAIMRGDAASRAAYFAALKQNELYTTNEIRKMNGDNPLDDPKADELQNPATSSSKDDPGEEKNLDE